MITALTLIALGGATAGWVAAPLWVRRSSAARRWRNRVGRWTRRAVMRRRQPAAHEVLPAALELTLVVLGSGGSLVAAVRVLNEHGREPVAGAAQRAVAAMENGRSLNVALHRLQIDLGPAYEALTGALSRAAARGGSLTSALDRLAIEATLARQRMGERRARRLPVVLLGPLVAVSLPSVLIGSLLPVAIVAFRDLGP